MTVEVTAADEQAVLRRYRRLRDMGFGEMLVTVHAHRLKTTELRDKENF